MDFLGQTRQRIDKAVGKDLAKYIEKPQKDGFGDFALPCFALAKEMRKNPAEIAREIAEKTKIKDLTVKAVGPYVNFYIDWSSAAAGILKNVDENYGRSKIKEIVIMDVFQANPFKSFHVGHVKNAVLGESIRRILEHTGRKTIAVNFNGDVGIHVARWLLYYKQYHKGTIPKDNFTKWSGEIYAAASQKAKEDAEFEKEAQELNRKLDKRDKKIIVEWKKIRDLCYKDFDRIQTELEAKVDIRIPESECEKPGKNLIMKLFKQKKIIQSDGAIGIDLGALGFFILLKSDGTALYSTKDFGLLQKKQKHKFDKMLYVIGSEQDFYLKQLFKAFDILGLYPEEKSIHISYGLVNLKEGKMASRLGNVILYEDLRDEAIERVTKEIEKRNANLKNKKEVAWKVGMGAIKFSMLHTENRSETKFDWDEVLNFEGRSGPYLQYSYVRAVNILGKNKSSKRKAKTDYSLLKEDVEIRMIKHIAEFPHVVNDAAEKYEPYMIANYLFDFCQDFNSFYNSLPVLKAEAEIREARLALVDAVRMVLKIGMNLLGMDAPEEM